MPNGYTPQAPSSEGTLITTDQLLKDPKRLARVIAPNEEIFLSTFLFTRDTTESGAVVFNRAKKNGAYPDRGDVQEIAPMADFPLIDVAEGEQDTAVATKHGFGFRVSKESEKRKKDSEVNKNILVGRNALVRQDANRLYKAFIDAGVPEQNAVGAWNSGTTDPRRDIRTAQAAIKNEKLGYNPVTVLINPTAALELELSDYFTSAMPRENAALNPFLSPGLGNFMRVEWVENEFVPEDEVLVLQKFVTGTNVIEWETEVDDPIQEAGQKKLYQVSRSSVPIVTDPLSVRRIRGVLA